MFSLNILYCYDDREQLISAETSTIKYEYTYDDRGNILTEKEYAVTVDENGEKVYTLIEANTDTYVYDETWKDKLISYNGQTITYDASGNPIDYMGHNLSWSMGRQLASFDNITYTYDENGIRASKTSNGVKTKYFVDLDGNVVYQTDETNALLFYYDRNNEVIGFRYNNDNYFYVKNQQGDITDIVDSEGEVVASYQYDAWGKIISISGSNLDIANLNPFRYRSYYYDADTNLYYLQSRYYDPEVCRFINCDNINYIGLSFNAIAYNPFAYCWNNPVNFVDYNGYLGWPGEIHNEVVNRIVDNYPYLIKNRKIKYSNGKYGYCDIMYLAGRLIWEVKRKTVSMEKAIKQLNKYVNGKYEQNGVSYSGFKRGDSRIKGELFTYSNSATTYYISYWYAGNGIIYYEYSKDSNLVPDPQTMESMAYFLVVYYTLLSILTLLTGGATAGGFLVPV